MTLSVFGEDAKLIKKGDVFTPVFDNVEGRDVVHLEKNNFINDLLYCYDEKNMTLDNFIKALREFTGDQT